MSLIGFIDVFTLDANASNPTTVVLEEDNIAIPTDRNALYKQVTGFLSAKVDSPDVTCDESDPDMPDDCLTYQDPSTGQWYKYYYPNDDTTQYLYETYPNQISPIDGVTDQHFIVWMRTEALPTFRKLYGKIPGNLNNGGGRFVINITANFEVNSFKGKKSLVISNLGSFGGKNPFPGQVFITLSTFSLIFGLFLVARELGYIPPLLKRSRD